MIKKNTKKKFLIVKNALKYLRTLYNGKRI